MTFNDNAGLDGSQVKRSGGGRAAAGVGIGGGAALILFLISRLFGVDLGIGGGEEQPADPGATATDLSGECRTGADANAKVECRMVGAANSLNAYWGTVYPQITKQQFVRPSMELFSGGVQTGCGNATSAVGPFYCPPDHTVYIDTSFFQTLTTQLGAEGGPLAELYVVAHEFGHHIQNISGIMNSVTQGDSGPASDSVRLELQADCFAGAWMADASQTKDANGNTLLQPPTQDQLRTAVDAAAAVGDDHIQSQSGGGIHTESFTHGSSDQRMRWLMSGYNGGPQQCDTFGVDGSQL